MSSHNTSDKCRTLIVEDDQNTAVMMSRLLQSQGHEVTTAGTVGDALGALAWNPHCIILDLILPDGNGVTILRRVRKSAMPARVAIVTGVDDPFGLDDITDLEPDAVFEKPLDIPRLLRWLKRKSARPKTV